MESEDEPGIGRRGSRWPAWQVVWMAGTVSTAVLSIAGISSALDTTTSQTCPGAPTPSGRGEWDFGVLCPSPLTVTTDPHELRGLLLIAMAAVWALATVRLAAHSSRVRSAVRSSGEERYEGRTSVFAPLRTDAPR
jgi:hypothetical protein